LSVEGVRCRGPPARDGLASLGVEALSDVLPRERYRPRTHLVRFRNSGFGCGVVTPLRRGLDPLTNDI